MMAVKMMAVKRLLSNDIIVVKGEVYEIGKAEMVVEPLGSWSTNRAGEWVGAGPQQTLRFVLICQTQRWIGFLFPITGEWIRVEEDQVTESGTFPTEVRLVDPDFHKKVTLN